MFTGLIKDLGLITNIQENAEGKIFSIQTKLISEIQIDDSVAVNGTCLTATKINSESFEAQAVHVTLEKTTLGTLQVGDEVNLELALRAGDRLGGHFVQGHVNGFGKLIRTISKGENFELTFSIPENLDRYMISEGSVALDGISLTIARIAPNEITVSIIPHTWHNTNLKNKNVGSLVNIEADVLAKYLEKFNSQRIGNAELN